MDFDDLDEIEGGGQNEDYHHKADEPPRRIEDAIMAVSAHKMNMDIGVVGNPKEVPIPVNLPPRPRDAGQFFSYLETMHYETDCRPEIREMFDKLLGGGQKSYSQRTIEMLSEDGTQVFKIGAFTSTRVQEVKEIVALVANADIRNLRVMAKHGKYWRLEPDTNQCSSKIKVCGIPNFDRPRFHYWHPICVVGGGYGGITCSLRLLRSGRDNFVIVEKHHDFGGGSWITVANKHTKLQTEKGTYHVRYIDPEESKPPGDLPTWPSRDQLLAMFRREARSFGLEDKAFFNTEVRKVPNPSYAKVGYYSDGVKKEKGDPCQNLEGRAYDVQYGDVGGFGETKHFQSGLILAWPGNLSFTKQLDLVGEDDFGGYIEYGSGGKTDYDQCDGKPCVLWGHGAFMIENVRTVTEYGASKLYVICRRKNLTAPKMVSWLISQTYQPGSASLLLRAFAPMYKLAGFDPWEYHSVTKDASRTTARIDQRTVFGVTDIYFLACYFKYGEVVESEIKRLTHHTVHLVNGRKLEAQVILKVVGIIPDKRVDEQFVIDEMRGIWINGDPLRMCISNGMHVSAANFGTFSVGPAITGMSSTVQYFVDYPDDMAKVRDSIPSFKATPSNPAYAVDGRHYQMTMMMMIGMLPMLGMRQAGLDTMKHTKQYIAHPLKAYLDECKAEWEMYCDMLERDDRPPRPPYPYTEEMIMSFIAEINKETPPAPGEPEPEPPQPITQGPRLVGPDNEEALPVALFFPGQGSQYVKMMDGVKDIPAVKEMLAKAKEILGYDLLKLCLDGPESKLEETRHCQPALFVAGLAGLEKLRSDRAEAVTRASVMAGLSLGEYTALCAAGVLSFEDGLRLVKLRGEAMQEAAEVGSQRMLSVVGLESNKLGELCSEAAEAEGAGAVCEISNYLFPKGASVGGTERAIQALKDLAEKANCLQAKVLKTSGAFHTSLMQPAQDKLAAALEEALPNMQPPKHTVWMNASAEPMRPGCDPQEIVKLLKRQLTNPVLWEPSVKAIVADGVKEFYEIGPQKQIKAMMKRIDMDAWKAMQNVEV